MANMLMMRYAASRGNENQQGGNRNEMNGGMESAMRSEMRGGSQNAYGRGMAYGGGTANSYNAMRSEAGMHETEEPMIQEDGREDRRNYEGGTQNRYRGQDGQWKSGSRRNAYENGMRSAGGYGAENRRNAKEEEHEYDVRIKPANVIEWPYGDPGMENRQGGRSGRQIGFGAQNSMGGGRSGGQMMGRGSASEMEVEPFTRETAMEWTRNMKNQDEQHPKGPRWKPDEAMKLAQKAGVDTDPEGEEFWMFYAALNAVYSDNYKVAKKYGLDKNDMFFADLAVAWLDDEDAVEDKAAMYYKCIVKHN